MPERPIGVTDSAAGAGVAEVRTRERSVGGNTVVEQYLIKEAERVRASHCAASTFRTLGIATANINVCSLFNKTGSGVLVAVRRMSLQVDHVSNSGTIRVMGASRITTAPTTGTLLNVGVWDTAQAHDADVEFRGATASDGGAATTLTATPGTFFWRQSVWRNLATTNQWQFRLLDDPIIPSTNVKDPVILREGEGILVTAIDAGSTSHHYIVNCAWEEFTLP